MSYGTHNVRTKEELTVAVVNLALQDIYVEEDSDASWDVRLTNAASRLHRALVEHPGATQILVTTEELGATIDPIREHVLSILVPAGFSPGQAVRSLNVLYRYILGFTAVASLRTRPAKLEADRMAELRSDEYPRLREAAGEFVDRFSDESFEYGLRQLMTGFGAELGH